MEYVNGAAYLSCWTVVINCFLGKSLKHICFHTSQGLSLFAGKSKWNILNVKMQHWAFCHLTTCHLGQGQGHYLWYEMGSWHQVKYHLTWKEGKSSTSSQNIEEKNSIFIISSGARVPMTIIKIFCQRSSNHLRTDDNIEYADDDYWWYRDNLFLKIVSREPKTFSTGETQ